MATKLLLTAEDFEKLLAGDDRRLELIRGEVYELSPVNNRHREVAGEVCRRVGNWNLERKAGSVGPEGGFTIELRPDTVRAPDISFVAKGRIPEGQKRRGFPTIAPDFIVEVRSPGDSWSTLVQKADQFFAAGTRMALLLEPDQFGEVHRPGQQPLRLSLDDVFDGADVLPGFTCRIADFFPEEYE